MTGEKSSKLLPSTTPDATDDDPNLGTKRYYKYPPVVGFHVSRTRLLNKIIQKLQKSLSEEERTDPTVLTLTAMGDQGKTQLAIDICRQTESKIFLAIFLLDASSHKSLQNAIDELFDTVRTPEDTRSTVEGRINLYWKRLPPGKATGYSFSTISMTLEKFPDSAYVNIYHGVAMGRYSSPLVRLRWTSWATSFQFPTWTKMKHYSYFTGAQVGKGSTKHSKPKNITLQRL